MFDVHFFFYSPPCGSHRVFEVDGLKGGTFLYFREVLLYDLWLGGSVCPAGQAMAAFYYSSFL
ncbi:MAG: hypothetical protein KAJ52_05285, partial [Sedimentisphaerales bacterium]|nr:hypothetical protein [Sedimentisphaerales bacterium]